MSDDTTDKPTDRTPTKPGWYRAQLRNFPPTDILVFARIDRDGRVRGSTLDGRTFEATSFEWGPNIDDALADLAAIRSALTSAGVTGDADGVRALVEQRDSLSMRLDADYSHGRDVETLTDEARIRQSERARAERDTVGRLAAYVETCAGDHASPEWDAAYSSLASALRQIERGDATLDDGPLGAALRDPKADPEPARTEPAADERDDKAPRWVWRLELVDSEGTPARWKCTECNLVVGGSGQWPCPRCGARHQWTGLSREDLTPPTTVAPLTAEPADERDRFDTARDLLIELAARYVTHCGLCCTFDDEKRVVVTRESCKCNPLERRIHEYLDTFRANGIRDLAAQRKAGKGGEG